MRYERLDWPSVRVSRCPEAVAQLTELLDANRAGGPLFCGPELLGTHDPENTGEKKIYQKVFLGLRRTMYQARIIPKMIWK
jgi:hypothetical protein